MSIFQALIIAIVEGITEFLPISSTAHMVITSTIMGIDPVRRHSFGDRLILERIF